MEQLQLPLSPPPKTGRSREMLYTALDQCRQYLSLAPDQPLDPYRTAARLGCDVAAHYFESSTVAGMLLQSESTRVVLLNAARPALSQRFTLAHEMVHLMLHPPEGQRVCAEGLTQQSARLEWEANEGAAELLLPYRQVLPLLAADAALPFSQKVQRLSSRFQVSPTVARFRIEGLEREWQAYLRGAELSGLPGRNHL